MYRLRKWYFDCLTPQKEYVFVYFAEVRFASATLRSLTVHLARPDKGVFVTKAIPLHGPRCPSAGSGSILAGLFHAQTKTASRCSRRRQSALTSLSRRSAPTDVGGYEVHEISGLGIPEGEAGLSIESFVLECSSAQGSVRLSYEIRESPEPKPVIITTGRKSAILWKPLGLNYDVSGCVALGEEHLEVRGATGYVDYLESTCLPPVVPVRTLYWGRLAQPDLGLAYMRAANADGTSAWSRLYGRAGNTWFETSPVSLAHFDPLGPRSSVPAGANGYSLCATNGVGRVELRVHHDLPVQQGSFIDHQNIGSSLMRALLRVLTRNPRSTKFLSHADVDLEVRGIRVREQNVPLIDEYVTL